MENETISRNFIEQIIDKDIEEGKCETVCTRFPPEPNGYLHIGHAKSILLNYGLAQEYHGKFNMRFDDTNPTKEKVEFVESIKADIEWLGADWEDRLFFASDYFDQMYEAAVKLIKKGKAFVCDLSAEEIRAYRGTLTEPGKNSPYRIRLGEIPPLPLDMQKPMPDTGKEIVVDIKLEIRDDGIYILTNLPDEYQFYGKINDKISVRNIIVKDGSAKISLSDNTIDVQSVDLYSVLATVSGVDISIVGDRCRNLIGQYVKFNPINGNSIEFHYKK